VFRKVLETLSFNSEKLEELKLEVLFLAEFIEKPSFGAISIK